MGHVEKLPGRRFPTPGLMFSISLRNFEDFQMLIRSFFHMCNLLSTFVCCSVYSYIVPLVRLRSIYETAVLQHND